MSPVAQYLLTAALILIIVAVVGNIIVLTSKKKVVAAKPVKVLVGAGAPLEEAEALADVASPTDITDEYADVVTPLLVLDDAPAVAEAISDDFDDGLVTEADTMDDADAQPVRQRQPRPAPRATGGTTAGGVGFYATAFTLIAFLLVTTYLIWRMAESGHGPFTNQHEFAVAFTWGILGAYAIVQWRFKMRMLSVIMLPVAACLLMYAMNLDASIGPLVPALQNSVLLTLHVGFAILSYGAACVSFASAALYLLYPRIGKSWKTPQDRFDEIGYKGAVVAFPLMTIMIVLGALWADTAWGSYWSWDPKETAALVTWLLYAAFLHARVMRGWRGRRSAWFLIVGFAAVLFAYFGNHFFGGLHSYV